MCVCVVCVVCVCVLKKQDTFACAGSWHHCIRTVLEWCTVIMSQYTYKHASCNILVTHIHTSDHYGLCAPVHYMQFLYCPLGQLHRDRHRILYGISSFVHICQSADGWLAASGLFGACILVCDHPAGDGDGVGDASSSSARSSEVRTRKPSPSSCSSFP